MASDDNIIKKYQQLLNKSKTAYTPNVKPTASDISLEQKLIKAKQLKEQVASDKLRQSWYPESSNDESNKAKDDRGYFEKMISTMSAPLYGIVGTAEAALGKGTTKGVGNIYSNIKERGTWGDLIRSYGVSNAIAMPLGMALDVATDPLAWFGAAESALIPKIFRGGATGLREGKGLVKGIATAAKSGGLEKLESAGRMIPGLTKRAYELDSQSMLPKAYRKLSEANEVAKGKYDAFMGVTDEMRLTNAFEKNKAFDKLHTALEGTPFGQKLIKLFGYSPEKYVEAARLRDADPLNRANFMEKAAGQSDEIASQIDDAAYAINSPKQLKGKTSTETSFQLSGEAKKDKAFKEAFQNTEVDIEGKKEVLRNFYQTEGFDTYNKLIARAVETNVGRKALDGYAKWLGLFKTSKIGPNPAAYMNGLVGNLFMTNMFGVNVNNVELMKSFKNGLKAAKGNDLEIVNLFTKNPKWRDVLLNRPESFHETFGINPHMIIRGRQFMQDQARKMLKEGKNIDGYTDLLKSYDDFLAKAYKKVGKDATSTVNAALSDQPTTFLTQEVMSGPFMEFVKNVEKMKNEGKPFAAALHWYLTKPMDAYGKIDQTYRVGLALHLSDNGISMSELSTVINRTKIHPSEVTKVAGRDLYKIDPERAMDVVGDVYLNYQAMPAFVQVMRTLPIIGSPFYSFSYGMMSNALKTAMYNPTFFNKVNYMLQELNGKRSPLEKEALEKPYYSWYNKNTMVKLGMLPFFQENPTYLNLANMIPYYSLNLFQSSERSYPKSGAGSALINMIDKTPFFKTPEGQLMLDYFIQPMIIKESQLKGSFGQPLWPADADLGDKIKGFALSAGEAVMPPAIGLGGLLTPSKIAQYVPSYRFRQLAYAKEGKGSTGVPTKEEALQHTARVLSSMAGLPIYQLKTQFSNK